MISETGRVVGIEPEFLWVETIRRSSCNSCAAQKGCGQGLLNKIGDGKRNHMRVLLGQFQASDFQLDDDVDIAVPEHVLVLGAMMVYLMPLLAMLLGMAVADHYGQTQGWAVLGALTGLISGLLLVRIHAWWIRSDPEYQPTVIGVSRKSHETLGFSPEDLG